MTALPRRLGDQLLRVLEYVAAPDAFAMLLALDGRCIASAGEPFGDRRLIDAVGRQIAPLARGTTRPTKAALGIPSGAARFDVVLVRDGIVLAVTDSATAPSLDRRARMDRALDLLRRERWNPPFPEDTPPPGDDGSGAPASPDLAWGTPPSPLRRGRA